MYEPRSSKHSRKTKKGNSKSPKSKKIGNESVEESENEEDDLTQINDTLGDMEDSKSHTLDMGGRKEHTPMHKIKLKSKIASQNTRASANLTNNNGVNLSTGSQLRISKDSSKKSTAKNSAKN